MQFCRLATTIRVEFIPKFYSCLCCYKLILLVAYFVKVKISGDFHIRFHTALLTRARRAVKGENRNGLTHFYAEYRFLAEQWLTRFDE